MGSSENSIVPKPMRNAVRYFSFVQPRVMKLLFTAVFSFKNRYTHELYHKRLGNATKNEYIFDYGDMAWDIVYKL